MKITIIGGGIAGLSVAIALEKSGYECVIYEAAPELKPAGAGITLQFNAMKAAHHLGVYDALLSKGQSMEKGMITDQHAKPLTKFNYEEHLDILGEVSLAIHRADLQQVLVDQLQHAEIITNKRVKSYEHSSPSKVTFTDGSSVDADYIIAADGINSVIRQTLVPGSTPQYAGYTCWRGIGRIPDNYPYKDTIIESWGPGQRLGVVPVKDDVIYWFAVKNAAKNDPIMKNSTKEDILQYFRKWNTDLLRVIHETDEDSIIWGDIADINPIKQFAFDKTLLVGDAAHATTPNMGQGGCQAMEDAATLLSLLKENSMDAAFKQFELLRLKKTTRVITQSRRIGMIGQCNAALGCYIRNTVLRLTPESRNINQLKWLAETAF